MNKMRWFTARGLTASLIMTLIVGLMLSASSASFIPSGPAQGQSVFAQTSSTDPDRPDLGGKVEESEYLRLREQYIAAERGLPYDFAAAARTAAIQALEAGQRANQAKALEASLASWTPIGPAPLSNGQTTSISTPVSGRVTAIAIHPANPDIVYVGTAQGGVYRTLNGGTTWTPLMDSADSLAIGSIAIAPSDPTIVYVGTGEPNQSCDSYFGVGLYRIDNADTTATLTGPINPNVTTGLGSVAAFTGRSISRILVHPTDPATIFVSTASGIGGAGCTALSTVPPVALRGLYRSTDATSPSPTFTKLTVTNAGSVLPDASGNRSISDMVFEPGNPNHLLVWVTGNAAVNDGGVYSTTNALTAAPTFAQVLQTTASNARGQFAINEVGPTVTVVVATGENSGRLHQSADGGATWPTTISSFAGTAGFCSGQCFYDIAVDMAPDNANVIYIGGSANGVNGNVLVKTTNGSTFNRIDTGLHADSHAVAIAPSITTTVYTGNDGGIWKSTNSGGTWTSLNGSTFDATQFESLALHPTDRYFTIGGTQDNGTAWLKPDNTWTRADYGDGGYARIDQNAADTTTVTMYHTYFNQTNNLIGFGRVNSTLNASDGNWTFLGCGGTANGINCTDTVLFYAPMALGPGNPNTLYFGTDRLYRSTNQGANMSVVSQSPFVSGVPVSTIGISPQDDNVRIVGLYNGQVFATTTGANPMTDVTSPSFPTNPNLTTNQFVGRAVIDPNNSNTAYVTFSFYAPAGQGVWKTTNLAGGAGTWAAAGNGIPSIPVNAFVVDPLDSNSLYAGTDIGVYHSGDGGANWLPFGTGLPRVAVFDMAIQNPHRILRIATHGRGMWEINLPSSSQAELSIGKAVTPTLAGPGQLVTYTLTYSNSSVTTASSTVITDIVPITLTQVNYIHSGALITPTGSISFTWQVADLAQGEGGIITLTGIVSPGLSVLPTTFTNTATITATNGASASSASAAVTVNALSGITDLSAVNSSPTTLGQQTFFTATAMGSGIVYTWNFGDSSPTVTGANVTRTYPATGFYTARVTATNGVSTVVAATLVTITNLAPTADAGPDQSVFVNAPVILDGSASTDPDGHLPLTFGWDQTGGPSVSLSDVAFGQPTFTAPGAPAILTFTLVVTDARGLVSAPDTVVVAVTDEPVSNLSASNSSPTTLGAATFFTATTNGSNITYHWNFRDGSAIAMGNPITHTYATTGTFTVIVTATNSVSSLTMTTPATVIVRWHTYLPVIIKSAP